MSDSVSPPPEPAAADARTVRCVRCGVRSPGNVFSCIACGKVVLAQRDHLLPIGVAGLLTCIDAGVAAATGEVDWLRLARDVAHQMVPAIGFVMLLIKGIQKRRDPRRRIGLELVALYSDRQGRTLVLLLTLGSLWLALQSWRQGASSVQTVEGVLTIATVVVAGAYLILYFRTLGRAFLDLSIVDAITALPEAIEQRRRHGLLKKLARSAVLHRLQGERFDLNLDFFARGWAHLYGWTPAQGEEILATATSDEWRLFEAAVGEELRDAQAHEHPAA